MGRKKPAKETPSRCKVLPLLFVSPISPVASLYAICIATTKATSRIRTDALTLTKGTLYR